MPWLTTIAIINLTQQAMTSNLLCSAGASQSGPTGPLSLVGGAAQDGPSGGITFTVDVARQAEDLSCYCYHDGSDYRGFVDVSVSGRPCQAWAVQSPHSHDFTPSNYPYAGLGSHSFPHSFCRNPDHRDRPWCLIAEDGIEWEYCDIDQCEEQHDGLQCYSKTGHAGGDIVMHAGNTTADGFAG
eukprot:scaffold575205_cov43-Prasinocladus_malaysianus.AAC.1